MCREFPQKVREMNAAATKRRINTMIRMESSGWGDQNNALDRICDRFKLPFGTLDNVRTGRTKRIYATEAPAKAMRPGAVELAGKEMWPDSRGAFVPVDLIKAEDRIEDEMVLKIIGFAASLSAEIARFRAHTFADVGDFQAVLDQEYGAKKGGSKGNVTFMSFDGLKKVQVQVADIIEFGPQLQTAKRLIDECLTEWSAEARPEIRTVVTRAFNTDKEGNVNRAELYRLRKWDIDDPRWHRAMDAITAASRAVGSREYVRFYERDRPDGAWRAITIDIASAS